jgi:hypothetical protein
MAMLPLTAHALTAHALTALQGQAAENEPHAVSLLAAHSARAASPLHSSA